LTEQALTVPTVAGASPGVAADVDTLPTFRAALALPELRWLLAHHAVGGTAQSLGTVAVAVHLYERTGSHGWVAAAAAGRFVPYLVVSSFGGLLADRMDRRRLLLWSALTRGLLLAVLVAAVALALPPLVIVGVVTLATTLGTPCYPAVAAVLPAVAPGPLLAPATGLLNVIETSVWLAGPALGGLLLIGGEPTAALALNAIAFTIAAALLLPLPAQPSPWRRHELAVSSMRTDLREGLAALAAPVVAGPLACVVAVNVLLGMSSILLLSAAAELFERAGSGYGLLTAAFGVGGFAGVLVTNRLATSNQPARCLLAMTALTGLPFVVLAGGGPLVLGGAVLVAAGVGAVATEVLAMTTLLRVLPGRLVARVVGAVDSLLVAALLCGSLVAPLLIDGVGTRGALVIMGVGTPAAALGATALLSTRR
jgi:MFS family permease